jgi:hypothetical protein
MKVNPGKGPFLMVSPPETARVSRSVIDLGSGRISIRLDDTKAWDCQLNPPVGREESASGRALEVIDGLLTGLPLESPFLKVVAGGQASGPAAYDSTESVINARVGAVVDSIETAWRLRCVAPVLQAMKQVIGLGFGLTPSGDDFLIGFLGASYFFAHGDDFRKAVFTSVRPLIHRTSLPSFFMLKAALEGLYPRPLSELFRVLEDGGAGEVRRATGRLTEIGATSGQDMLSGVLSWLHISSMCGAADAAHRS